MPALEPFISTRLILLSRRGCRTKAQKGETQQPSQYRPDSQTPEVGRQRPATNHAHAPCAPSCTVRLPLPQQAKLGSWGGIFAVIGETRTGFSSEISTLTEIPVPLPNQVETPAN